MRTGRQMDATHRNCTLTKDNNKKTTLIIAIETMAAGQEEDGYYKGFPVLLRFPIWPHEFSGSLLCRLLPYTTALHSRRESAYKWLRRQTSTTSESRRVDLLAANHMRCNWTARRNRATQKAIHFSERIHHQQNPSLLLYYRLLMARSVSNFNSLNGRKYRRPQPQSVLGPRAIRIIEI